jgi:hypothetical protein
VELGSLKDLAHVSVIGCSRLVHPPQSQQLDPAKTAAFLKKMHCDSEEWRRLKVQ